MFHQWKTTIHEWLESHSNPKTRLFRDARQRHEALMKREGIVPTDLSDEQRSRMRQSMELIKIERLYEEALHNTQADGAHYNESIVHQQLGLLYFIQGDDERARRCYGQSLEILEQLPGLDASGLSAIGVCHYFLSLVDLNEGRSRDALDHAELALETDQGVGDLVAIAADRELLARCRKALEKTI